MLKNDLIHCLSDGIMQHEGYTATSASFKNKNPGNLRFVGQAGAIAGPQNFCVFPDFYTGKQALNNDIGAKMLKLNTIRDIITEYAPPNQNDTEAYIASVCAFLLSRNVVLNPDSPIDAFLSQCQTPIALIVVNQIWEPADWAAIQAAIVQAAKYMPQYVFSLRYSDGNLSGNIVEVQNANPPGGVFSGISGPALEALIAPYNQGQVLNLAIYDGTIMVGHPEPYGGCEFHGLTESAAPISSVSGAIYNGTAFVDPLARVIFHELIHALFDLTHQMDTLHAYLIEHGGYTENLAVDLEAVFTGNQLNTPTAIANLENSERSLPQ